MKDAKIVVIRTFVNGFKHYANGLSKRRDVFEKNGGGVHVFSGSLEVSA